MSGAPPAGDGGRLFGELLILIGQADGDDVFLVDDITVESQQGDVVLEVGWVVARMNLLTLDVVVLVRVRLARVPHIPLAQSDPQARAHRTVRNRNNSAPISVNISTLAL